MSGAGGTVSTSSPGFRQMQLVRPSQRAPRSRGGGKAVVGAPAAGELASGGVAFGDGLVDAQPARPAVKTAARARAQRELGWGQLGWGQRGWEEAVWSQVGRPKVAVARATVRGWGTVWPMFPSSGRSCGSWEAIAAVAGQLGAGLIGIPSRAGDRKGRAASGAVCR